MPAPCRIAILLDPDALDPRQTQIVRGLARAVADLALARGLRIPEDVGLVAADDDPVLCELPPALTSLHFDYAEVGVRAGQLLGRLMAGQRAPAKNVLVAPTLVPRLSTDRAAVADPLVAKALWFLDDRRTEAIRPRQVAEAVGLRLRALEGRLQRARGRTVAQEIARARVEHAKILLGDPGYSPCSVARQSGFGSYDALLRAFKRHAGMVPSAWQREALLRRRGAPDAETLRRRRRARRKRNGEA
jgi:AraC-like DNA-binding protein